MADLSDFLEAGLLDHLFRGASSPRQDSYWVALFTTATSDDGSGTEVSTGNWTNYSRVEVDASAASSIFNAAASEAGGGQRSDTDNEIDFGTATISGSDVEVTHVALMTASSGGNMLFHGALGSSRTIFNGAPVKFEANDLGFALR